MTQFPGGGDTWRHTGPLGKHRGQSGGEGVRGKAGKSLYQGLAGNYGGEAGQAGWGLVWGNLSGFSV